MTAPPLDASTASTARIDGREIIVFGGCNYLGLAQHPAVLHAAQAALKRFGLSASASRETTGNTAPHQELESALPRFCGHESGLLVPDGYIANLAALQGLAATGIQHAVVDERAHASLSDAARLAGLPVRRFRHGDAHDAAEQLRGCEGPAVVLTDSVFAANGAIAPASALLDGLRPDDRLLLDDCHGLCVLGRRGRGAADHAGLPRDRLVVTTTLAKGLGCAGGIVMGPSPFVERCRRLSTAYVCTTPASPILTAAALEAVRLLDAEPALHDRLRANVEHLGGVLTDRGLHAADHPTPIFAFTIGDATRMRVIHRAAWNAGVWMPLVEYPGGPSPVYFRLSVTASHVHAQIDRLGSLLAELGVDSDLAPLENGAA